MYYHQYCEPIILNNTLKKCFIECIWSIVTLFPDLTLFFFGEWIVSLVYTWKGEIDVGINEYYINEDSCCETTEVEFVLVHIQQQSVPEILRKLIVLNVLNQHILNS